MKKTASTLLACAFLALASTAFAAPPPAEVSLKSKNGDVNFNHKLHQAQGCKKCHGAGTPSKIELDKDKAHALCTECHKEKAKGPETTKDAKKCTACHSKNK